MRIAQITDLHLDDFLARKHEVDTKSHFATILSALPDYAIDHLVLTGDFGDPGRHRWIREQLGGRPGSFDTILGNHDSLSEMRESGLAPRPTVSPSEYYYGYESNQTRFLFLDSSSGSLSSGQLLWLGQELKLASERVVLFCHHPILDVNAALDRALGMRNRREVEAVLKDSGRAIWAFCGHYHCSSVTTSGRIKQYVAPASLMQIRGEGEAILTDSFDYGFLLIEVDGASIDAKPVMMESERRVL